MSTPVVTSAHLGTFWPAMLTRCCESNCSWRKKEAEAEEEEAEERICGAATVEEEEEEERVDGAAVAADA